jgi:sugar phosphate isomerase/epimerase
MQRREFLRTVEVSTVATAAGVLAGQSAEAGTRVAAEKPYAFRLGIYLPELGLPLDESLEVARQVGSKHVWFSRITGEPDVASWSDARAAKVAAQVKAHDLDIFLLNAGSPFKKIHLAELDYKTLASHPAFRRDLAALVRSMQIASHIGVSAVGSFTFAWPGEYTAGKPTWPMRWMTRGGLIAQVDEDKWLKAFSLVVEQAEKYDVDVALSMMPWNYTNTTVNFRHLAERLGSKRLKLMWGPADNLNSGEWDTATAGFQNARPYLHGLHLKDLHVKDGLRLDFEYRPLGEGDVDYMTVLKNLRQHRCDAVLSVSTHFLPPGGTRIDAMKINYANLRGMIGKLEAEV